MLGSLSRMVAAFKASDEFAELKPRTRKDYAYYLDKIEMEFGHLPVAAMSALVIKEYYKRVRREKSVTWSYHIMGSLHATMSWGVSENWLEKNPALDVVVKSPPKRTVKWEPEQAGTYIKKACELGWASIAGMAYVFDSTAQSPIDVRLLTLGNYDGLRISNARIKTGVTDAATPLPPTPKPPWTPIWPPGQPCLPDAPFVR
jgi:hypothetical protein